MMITRCEAVQPELKAYLDGALNPIARVRVRRHLETCEACRREMAMVERIGKELQSMDMATLGAADSDKLDPGLRARILAAIPSEPPVSGKKPIFSSRFSGRPVFAIGAIGAAVAAVVVLHVFLPGGSPSLRMMDSHKAASFDTASANQSKAPAAAQSQASAASPGAVGGSGAGAGESWRNGAMKAEKNQPDAPAASQNSQFRAAVATSPMTPLPATGSPANEDAAMDSLKKAAPFRPQYASGFSGSFADGRSTGSHTYIARNLPEGEKAIRKAAADFGGSVANVNLTNGGSSKTIELVVSVPASRAAALLQSIPINSGGALREDADGARVSQPPGVVHQKGSLVPSPPATVSTKSLGLHTSGAARDEEQGKLVVGMRIETRSGNGSTRGKSAGKAVGPKSLAKQAPEAMVQIKVLIVRDHK